MRWPPHYKQEHEMSSNDNRRANTNTPLSQPCRHSLRPPSYPPAPRCSGAAAGIAAGAGGASVGTARSDPARACRTPPRLQTETETETALSRWSESESKTNRTNLFHHHAGVRQTLADARRLHQVAPVYCGFAVVQARSRRQHVKRELGYVLETDMTTCSGFM